MTSDQVKKTHDLLVSYNPQRGNLSAEMVQKISDLFQKEIPNLPQQFPTNKDLIKHYLGLNNWQNPQAVEEFLRVYINEEDTLDLSRIQMKITSLPPAIRHLAPHLTTLIVSGHELSTLPVEIAELLNLKILRADRNRLSTLPSIAKLDALEELDVSYNRLKSLPDPLFRSFQEVLAESPTKAFSREKLSLNFSYNWIENVPADIFSNGSVTFFDFDSNRLNTWPEEDPNWGKIEYFSVENNPRPDPLV